MSIRTVFVDLTPQTIADMKRREELLRGDLAGLSLEEYDQELARVNFDLATIFCAEVRLSAKEEGWEI